MIVVITATTGCIGVSPGGPSATNTATDTGLPLLTVYNSYDGTATVTLTEFDDGDTYDEVTFTEAAVKRDRDLPRQSYRVTVVLDGDVESEFVLEPSHATDLEITANGSVDTVTAEA